MAIAIVFSSALAPAMAIADAARPAVPPARNRPAPTEAPSGFNRLVLNQLLNAVGKPSFQLRFQLRATEQGTSINGLSGRVQVPFRRDISFPLQEPTNQAQLDRLIPTVVIGTNGGSLVTQVESDDANDRTRVSISFVRAQGGSFVPVTIRAELVDFLALQIESVQVTLNGLKNPSGVTTVDGTCAMKQAVVNTAGQNVWQPVDCRFSGRFDQSAQTYQVDFSYDSLGR